MPREGLPVAVSGLTRRFGAVTAVDDVSFTVHPGRVTGFLGPNGAGRTTTLRCLLDLAFNALDVKVGKYLRMSASNALLSAFSGGAAQLDRWAGGLVRLGYALVFSLVGVPASVSRDIT